jgi:hypothetical protein
MRAKLIENIEFERGLEPNKAMGIGLTSEQIVVNFVAELKELGVVDLNVYPSINYAHGYDVVFNDKDAPDLNNYSITYIDDKKAKEIGENSAGWVFKHSVEDDHFLHNTSELIKKILEEKYGFVEDVDIMIETLNKVKKILANES